jgi:hypothetical protein
MTSPIAIKDLLNIIISDLRIKTIAQCRLVCKYWYSCIKDVEIYEFCNIRIEKQTFGKLIKVYCDDPALIETKWVKMLTTSNIFMLRCTPHIEELHFYGKQLILPLFTNLKKLFITSTCNIPKIPTLPQLEFLECSYNGLIHEIEGMPKLNALNCQLCITLQYIGNCPELEKFNCESCFVLVLQPEYLNLNELNCRRTHILPRIMPNLVKLDCRFCLHITDIPPYPKLKILKCKDCPLISFPDLPELEEVDNIEFSYHMDKYPKLNIIA